MILINIVEKLLMNELGPGTKIWSHMDRRFFVFSNSPIATRNQTFFCNFSSFYWSETNNNRISLYEIFHIKICCRNSQISWFKVLYYLENWLWNSFSFIEFFKICNSQLDELVAVLYWEWNFIALL